MSFTDPISDCRQLYGGMICIRSYTRRCMTLGQRGHFLKLFHGPQQVVRELCREGPLQNGEWSWTPLLILNRLIWNVSFAEFLKHSSCLKTCSDDYKQCATNYNNALLQVQLQETVANNHTSNLVCWWVKWHTPTSIDTKRFPSLLAARSVNTSTVQSLWC